MFVLALAAAVVSGKEMNKGGSPSVTPATVKPANGNEDDCDDFPVAGEKQDEGKESATQNDDCDDDYQVAGTKEDEGKESATENDDCDDDYQVAGTKEDEGKESAAQNDDCDDDYQVAGDKEDEGNDNEADKPHKNGYDFKSVSNGHGGTVSAPQM
ncbi:hypothetical protein PsorP6_015226 [Peronosclerospora sorghi]|uniref:Uncharacterized protein n=1 Tax=Peronosclerospora sorghi TaxID=230839 RepID=A0ACC0VTY7_9STRA|nr:hypothetical protein PsorP6_015226 [Peronosclerospora sorghi]